MREFVETAEEVDRLQILIPAVAIGNPLAGLSGIVEIQHRCDSIDAQSVDVILLQPKECVGDQELPDFIASEVEDQGAPVEMLTLARVFVFVASGTVKARQSMGVFWKVCGHPIDDDRDASLVTGVDEILEV